MSVYRVEISRRVLRMMRPIPNPQRAQIFAAIEALADEPRPDGVRKLQGLEDTYRIRVGQYRVIYTIDDGELVVVIVRAAHRQGAY